LLGARFLYGGAAGLRISGDERVVALRDRGEVTGRAVIVTTGVSYRRLGIPAVDRLVGRGVFYGAAAAEAQAMSGRHVYVVGGANSAGQAAVHLSRYADEVTLVVRRPRLTETMSAYLVREIEALPRIRVRYGCEVVDGRGEDRLTGLTLRDRTSGAAVAVPAGALFVLIGAEPHTGWLPDSVRRDTDGFVLTGVDLLMRGGSAVGLPAGAVADDV
jgi:thioredoxin reductase (NADPH)